MIVVTPNLCFDRTLRTDRFEAGTVSRPSRVTVTAGGKGVNVARTMRDLGRSARLVGLLPAAQGPELQRLLAEEGASLRAVPVGGAVRCATIILEDGGRATVLNEPGPQLGEPECEALLAALAEELAATPAPCLVACAGSLPPGLPADTYGRVAALVHAHGGTVVVDAAREALSAALPFGADAVTPNLAEAVNLLDGSTTELSEHDLDEVTTRAAALDAARRLRARGVRRAIVTVGSHGVAWVGCDGDEHWEPALRVVAVNPIGAGDSFAAGLLTALDGGRDWAGAVRYAVAVAGAAVENPTAGRVDPARVGELAEAAR